MDIYSILKNEPQIWDQFSKKEEYSPKQLDSHERFNYSYTIHKDVTNPNVSSYLLKNGLKVEYPDNKKFAVCLTHDIDDIYPPLTHTLLSSVHCFKQLNFKELIKQISWKIRSKTKSPYINFKEIMDLEDKYNAKSSFYFIATENDPRRFRYNVEDIENELKFIVDNGWEVGLHGGYYSYNNYEEIFNEKRRLESLLGKEIIGFRNHYLRFKTPDSWKILSKAGFKYDTTFGYSDMVGFRNGMCHPFKPYDLNEEKEIDILEIPLVIMDVALFDVASSFEEAWNCAKKLIDTVEENSGIITILWHNNVFSSSFRFNWLLLYEKILKYCYEKNAWMASGEEIWKFWTRHH